MGLRADIPKNTSFMQEIVIYASRVKYFSRVDWIVYFLWVGMIFGLFGITSYFTILGASNGVEFPPYVWNIPMGAFIFGVAISFDTIGHRTVYKEELEKAEKLIHHITIAMGIGSVMLLCLAYDYPSFMLFPTIVLIALSTLYSIFDEAMHWHRYYNVHSDRVEMWSHVFIMVGHNIMIYAWLYWYLEGYPGVRETLKFL